MDTAWRALVAAGVVVLGSCSSQAGSQGGAEPRPLGIPQAPNDRAGQTELDSVVIVGDSITEGSEQELTETLRGSGLSVVQIEGETSRRIEVGNGKGSEPLSGIRTIYTLLAEGADPSAWVIELGTNDVGSYPDAESYETLIDSILDMLPDDVPVVWVNTYREQYLDDTQLFNSVLEDRIDARGNAVVADWYSVASAKDQNVLRSDNLHPNENGQRALAWLVLAALQEL